MRWSSGPRRASPTTGRWQRLGRIAIARLRIPGNRPVRVLLIGERAALDEIGPDGADLGSAVASTLASTAGRGVDLDLLADPVAVLPTIRSDDRFWRLWRYDALVVVLPGDPGGHRRAELITGSIVERVRSQSAVLVVHDPAAPAPRRPDGRGLPWSSAAIDLASSGAAAAARAVVDALTPLLPAAAGPDDRAPGSATHDPLGPADGPARSGLDRVVRIAKRSFAVDIAAVNLVTRTELITVAVAGAEVGRRPRESSLCDRTTRSGQLDVIPDTWREPSLRGHPVVRGPDPIRFYAGHPIESPDGARIGALCLYDRRPHDPEEFDFTMLRDLALLAEAELIAAAG